MEELLKRLKEVSRVAPRGSHEQVSDAMGISNSYLLQIRKGKNMTKDTAENRENMKDLISEYIGIIKEEQQKLSNF